MFTDPYIRSSMSSIVVTAIVIAATTALAEAEPEVITNSIDMKLVKIPAGEFLMGAEDDRVETLKLFPYYPATGLDIERPQHLVRITKSFYMGQYEVTLGQFMKFYKHQHDLGFKTTVELEKNKSPGYNENHRFTNSVRYRPWAPLAWQPDEEHPVVYVSWNDAVAFCRWLSNKEGKTYRLPTEAEWEYACRAGTKQRYYFGDDPDELVNSVNGADADLHALFPVSHHPSYNREGNRDDPKVPFPYMTGRDGYAWTAPVGKFPPNAYGLYDMHGNVQEWCSDWFDKGYYSTSPVDDPQGPPSAVEDPEAPSRGKLRTLRGGTFTDAPARLRCAARTSIEPWYTSCNTGFRIVCVP